MCKAEVVRLPVPFEHRPQYLEVLAQAGQFHRPTFVVEKLGWAAQSGCAVLTKVAHLYLCLDHIRDAELNVGWGICSTTNERALQELCPDDPNASEYVIGVMPRSKRWCSRCPTPKKARSRYDPARPYKFIPPHLR